MLLVDFLARQEATPTLRREKSRLFIMNSLQQPRAPWPGRSAVRAARLTKAFSDTAHACLLTFAGERMAHITHIARIVRAHSAHRCSAQIRFNAAVPTQAERTVQFCAAGQAPDDVLFHEARTSTAVLDKFSA